MKKVIITICLAAFAISSFAQNIEKAETNADKFSKKSGTLVESEFIDIGTVKGVDIQIMKMKDLVAGTSIKALRLEYEVESSYSTDTKLAGLDVEEIDGLLKSIKALRTAMEAKKENYTEVTFKSKSGYSLGAYYDNKKSTWSSWMKIEQFDSKSYVFLSAEELASFQYFIEKAKSQITL